MSKEVGIKQPYGAVILDVAEYTDSTTRRKMYNSVLTYFLDELGEDAVSLLTDVHTDDYFTCIERTLQAISNLYAQIGAEVTVFDINTAIVLYSFNLNDLYPDGFSVNESNSNMLESLEKPKYLH